MFGTKSNLLLDESIQNFSDDRIVCKTPVGKTKHRSPHEHLHLHTAETTKMVMRMC